MLFLFLFFSSIHSQWVSLSMLAHARAHTCALTSVCRFAPVHCCPAHCALMVDPIVVEFHQLAYWMGQCVGVCFVYFGFGQECVHHGVGVSTGLSGCYVY